MAARTLVPLAVVRWAADECARQRSGETSVTWMVEGWAYAMRHRRRRPTYGDVLALGRIVEPRKAALGTRTCGVRVGMSVKMPWEQVDGALRRLVEAQPVPDPLVVLPPNPAQGRRAAEFSGDVDEWYRQYEEIHPFADGNGRTGSLLWNWLRGSLPDPAVPPDFWKDDPHGGLLSSPLAGDLVGDLRDRAARS